MYPTVTKALDLYTIFKPRRSMKVRMKGAKKEEGDEGVEYHSGR